MRSLTAEAETRWHCVTWGTQEEEQGSAANLYPTSVVLISLQFPSWKGASWLGTSFGFPAFIKEKLDSARFFQICFVLFLKESLPSKLGNQNLRRQGGPFDLQIVDPITSERVLGMQGSG